MHTLLFGGTFDPIHHGHLLTARAALEALQADRILLMPAAISPHKTSVTTASAAHRLAMCRLAVAPDPRFAVSDIEVKRAGPSYTIDTVEELQRAEPQTEWTMVIGADQLPKLHTWHRISELAQKVRIAILERAGSVSESGAVGKYGGKVVRMLTPVLEISATAIRKRVAEGRPIRWLVPEAVEEYVRQAGLYRAEIAS